MFHSCLVGAEFHVLKSKTALITGGNSGIGLATARRFVPEGAHVKITGRDAATLAAAANELGVTAIKSDVLDTQARSSLFEGVSGRPKPTKLLKQSYRRRPRSVGEVQKEAESAGSIGQKRNFATSFPRRAYRSDGASTCNATTYTARCISVLVISMWRGIPIRS